MSATPLLDEYRKRSPRPGEATFFYRDFGFKREAVKLLPGEYFVCNLDVVLTTVLGSCVAACLVDRGAGVGGMNHFLLPDGNDSSARYGVNAMELLINELLRNGARRSALEAKIFGGAAVIQGMTRLNVGAQNVDFVQGFLARERVPIVSSDVRDVHARKVCLFPQSGKAMVKKLPVTADTTVVVEESRYMHSVAQAQAQSRGGEVELF